MNGTVEVMKNSKDILKTNEPNIYSNMKSGNATTQTGGNKLLLFIKAHPFYFSLIVIGACAVVATAIAIPVALANKKEENNDNNNNNDNNGQTEEDTTNVLDNPIIVLSNSQKNKILEIYNNIGSNDKGTLDLFCNYLKEQSAQLNGYQKVYLTYYWVANNIKYDVANYLANNPSDCNPPTLFPNKKTVCSGYSKLFTHLLKAMDYPESNIENIIGYSKGYGFNPENPITGTDHEWNAVKINEDWCLIDTTWGAGSISNGVFKPSYLEYYLCTPPEQFI